MLCSTNKIKDVNIKSPYGKRWHIHSNLQQKFRNRIFLIFATKAYKIKSLFVNTLSPRLRVIPYYLQPNLYIKSIKKIVNSRRFVPAVVTKNLFLLKNGLIKK